MFINSRVLRPRSTDWKSSLMVFISSLRHSIIEEFFILCNPLVFVKALMAFLQLFP